MMPNSAEIKAFAALALARAGDSSGRKPLCQRLSKLPWLGTDDEQRGPSVHSSRHGSWIGGIPLRLSKNSGLPFPMISAPLPDGVAMYYRGLAYLELQSGQEAAAQFQEDSRQPRHGDDSQSIGRWPTSGLPAHTRKPETLKRASPNIANSWSSGRMPTLICESLSKRRRSTQPSANQLPSL